MKTCSISDCRTLVHARGLCTRHYRRDIIRTGKAHSRGPIEQCGYKMAHYRCFTLWGSAKQYSCVKCGKGASQWAYDGTDPTGQIVETGPIAGQRFSSFPEFYMPMCHMCHKRKDGASAKAELLEYRLWKHNNPGRTLQDLDGIPRPKPH